MALVCGEDSKSFLSFEKGSQEVEKKNSVNHTSVTFLHFESSALAFFILLANKHTAP
jgi:hypothetical protein